MTTGIAGKERGGVKDPIEHGELGVKCGRFGELFLFGSIGQDRILKLLDLGIKFS